MKLWSLDEANRAIPRLERMVSELRAAYEAHRFALENVADLQRLHGPEAIREAAHPAHGEYARFLAEGTAARERLAAALAEFERLEAEVKDPVLGLVDFPTLRGREVVYLCWRQGEREITHWHSMTGGFAGRKPLDDLVKAGGR